MIGFDWNIELQRFDQGELRHEEFFLPDEALPERKVEVQYCCLCQSFTRISPIFGWLVCMHSLQTTLSPFASGYYITSGLDLSLDSILYHEFQYFSTARELRTFLRAHLLFDNQ